MEWVALWRAFLHTIKYSFLMISLKLHDFSPFFLLIFSPLGTANFLMLLELPGDGYSLLCSKKQPLRHTFYQEALPPKNLIFFLSVYWLKNKILLFQELLKTVLSESMYIMRILMWPAALQFTVQKVRKFRSNPKSLAGGKSRLWHRVKVDSGIGLPKAMVNVFESTLENT